jgi:uncharacterized membrane protein YhhN
VKGLSIAALALLAFLLGRKVSADFPILGIALTLSSIGDVLLDLDPERLFVAGLSSFLLTHLTYVILFVRNRPKPFAMGTAQVLGMTLVLLYTLTISFWLLPSLGQLIVPVAIYMCAITAMVLTCIVARFSSPWIICGAILFLVSDSLLAVNKFKTPIPYRDYPVWSTYYAAQFAIAIGFLSILWRAHSCEPRRDSLDACSYGDDNSKQASI